MIFVILKEQCDAFRGRTKHVYNNNKTLDSGFKCIFYDIYFITLHMKHIGLLKHFLVICFEHNVIFFMPKQAE